MGKWQIINDSCHFFYCVVINSSSSWQSDMPCVPDVTVQVFLYKSLCKSAFCFIWWWIERSHRLPKVFESCFSKMKSAKTEQHKEALGVALSCLRAKEENNISVCVSKQTNRGADLCHRRCVFCPNSSTFRTAAFSGSFDPGICHRACIKVRRWTQMWVDSLSIQLAASSKLSRICFRLLSICWFVYAGCTQTLSPAVSTLITVRRYKRWDGACWLPRPTGPFTQSRCLEMSLPTYLMMLHLRSNRRRI